MYELAAGPAPHALGRQILYKAPYAWFMPFPGFDAIRVPARFVMLATLCMAVVVAFAFAGLSARRNNWRRPIWIALSIGLLTDGWFTLRFVTAPGSPGETWAGVAGVVELPLGDPDRDAMALYRSITHGVPLLNGYSGYFAPQYPALKDALSTGNLAAIDEFTTYGPIGIAIDRSDPAHGPVEEAVARLDGVTPVHISPQWATFVIPRSVRADRPAGARLPITRVRANRKAEDVWRLFDGNIETAWGSGTSQNGDEEVVIDLEGIRTVGQVVLRLGPNSFGFPRDLAVDTSVDGVHWSQAWRGRPVVETVRAALENPGDVPVSIDIGSTKAQFVRLRQLGLEPAIPWWVAELSLHEPGGER
jgi:hypothetical protein